MSDAADAPPAAADAAPPPAADPNAAPPVTGAGQDAPPPSAPGEGDKPAPAAADAAPEPFTLAAPEGMDQFQGDFDKFATDMDSWLKANPTATPQQALAEAAQRQAKAITDGQAAAIQSRNTQIEGWETSLKNDPEFGGEKFEANIAAYHKGIDALGTPELRQILEETGLGSHPEIVRAFTKAAQLSADTAIVTGAHRPQAASAASRMYPDMSKGKD